MFRCDIHSLFSFRFFVVFGLFTFAATLGIYWKGRDFTSSLIPPADLKAFCRIDFSQEWLSAKNYYSCMPVYLLQKKAILAHFGETAMKECTGTMPYNAHPPGAVLLALPFGLLEHRWAFITWTTASLLASLAAFTVLSKITVSRISIVFIIILSCLTATSHPAQESLSQGQFNSILLLLLSGAWLADRHHRPDLTGFLLAVATFVKLFPGLGFVMLMFTRNYRALASGIAWFMGLTLTALLVLGAPNVVDYGLNVLPSISRDHMASWNNHSLPGLWCKLFNPERSGFIPLYQSRTIQRIADGVTYLAALVFLSWITRKTRNCGDRDGLFPLTLTLALLLTPVTWNHSFLLLLLPIAWLYSKLQPFKGSFFVLTVCTAVLYLPQWTIWRLILPGQFRDGTFGIIRPIDTLTGLSLQLFAVITLLVLCTIVTIRQPAILGSAQRGCSRMA
jgi:hypothetical protein